MMKGKDASAICPFFITQNKKVIECESLVKGAEKNTIMFPTEKKQSIHFIMCCSQYGSGNCQHAAALNMIYERGLK